MTQQQHNDPPVARSRAMRWTMVILGLVFLAIGGVGAVVPGLPTTIFLILASYFFTRSCPPLDDWMRNSRLFRPYARYLDRTTPMPTHAVVLTLLFIWVAIGFSMLRLRDAMPMVWLSTGAVMLGAAATASVVWYGRISIQRAQARQALAEEA